MKINDAFRFNAKPCKARAANAPQACGAKFSVFAKFVERLSGPITFEQGLKIEHMWEGTDGKVYQYHFYDLGFVCSCGKYRVAHKVLGKFNPGKKCSAKCLASTGHQCECACGGKNHGAGHEARA